MENGAGNSGKGPKAKFFTTSCFSSWKSLAKSMCSPISERAIPCLRKEGVVRWTSAFVYPHRWDKILPAVLHQCKDECWYRRTHEKRLSKIGQSDRYGHFLVTGSQAALHTASFLSRLMSVFQASLFFSSLIKNKRRAKCWPSSIIL